MVVEKSLGNLVPVNVVDASHNEADVRRIPSSFDPVSTFRSAEFACSNLVIPVSSFVCEKSAVGL